MVQSLQRKLYGPRVADDLVLGYDSISLEAFKASSDVELKVRFWVRLHVEA